MTPIFGNPNIEKLKSKHDVEGLLKLVNNAKDKKIQKDAIAAIGKMDDPNSTSILVSLLHHKDSEIAQVAIIALGDRQDPRVINSLIGILNTSIWGSDSLGNPRISPIYKLRQVQEAASDALIRIGAVAVEPLMERLKIDPEWHLPLIIRTLGGIHDPRVVQPLISLLSQSDSISSEAKESLQRAGSMAVKPLLANLRNKDPMVKVATLEVLGNIGQPEAIPALKAGLKDPDRRVRICSIKALGHLGDKSAFNDLVELLQDQEKDVKIAVASVLAKFGERKAIESLINELKYFTEPNNPIVEAIKKLKPTSEQMISALNSEFSGIRRGAAEILLQSDDPLVIDPLQKAVSDEALFVREAAARALEKFSDKHLVGTFVQALRDPYGSVREIAIRFLEKVGFVPQNEIDAIFLSIAKQSFEDLNTYGNRVIDPLISTLSYQEPVFQKSAADHLGCLKDPRAVRPLIAVLSCVDAQVRQTAATALGKLGDRSAIPPLMRLLSDGYQEHYIAVEREYGIYDTLIETESHRLHYPVRFAAAEAIRKLTQDPNLLKVVEDTDFG